jgi:hypothetical protein
VGDVDWVALHGPYENAAAVPALLRALRSADPAERERAKDRLENWHFTHQEGIWEPAVAAVPFLIEIVADARVPDRRPACRLLDLIVRLAGDHPEPRDPAAEPTLGELEPHPDNDFELYPQQVTAYAAVRAGVPTFLTLLRDPDPQLRTAAASLLAHFPSEWATMAPVLTDQLTVEDVPSVAAALCTCAGLAGRPGDDRVVAALVRWRGHHGRFVHRAALTGLARVQTVPDRATLTELVRCLILPATDGWRWMTPELKSVHAARSALSGRRPSEVPYLADLLLARLSRLEPDESSELALQLLMCFAFPDGPLHGEITFTGLTRRQRDVVYVLLDSGAFDRDPAVPWPLARYNLPRRSADLIAWASNQWPLFQ